MIDPHSFADPWRGVRAELEVRTARPGNHGDAVRRVQEHLHLRDASLGVDGYFGAGTSRGVRDLQTAEGLEPTGVVDAATWARLVAPLARAFAPLSANGRDLRALVAAAAAQHLAEHPREVGGDNCGPWVRAYCHVDGRLWAWCAGLACAALLQACEALGVPPPFQPSLGVPQLTRAAQAAGRFVTGARAAGVIAPGDLFVVPRAGSHVHVGVVASIDGPRFTSVEGNAGPDGNRDGDAARALVHPIARMDFLRVGS